MIVMCKPPIDHDSPLSGVMDGLFELEDDITRVETFIGGISVIGEMLSYRRELSPRSAESLGYFLESIAQIVADQLSDIDSARGRYFNEVSAFNKEVREVQKLNRN